MRIKCHTSHVNRSFREFVSLIDLRKRQATEEELRETVISSVPCGLRNLIENSITPKLAILVAYRIVQRVGSHVPPEAI